MPEASVPDGGAALPPAPVGPRLVRIYRHFRSPGWAWVVAVIATLVVSLTEPLIPALLQPLLDRGFRQRDLPLWTVPVALVLLFGVRGLATFLAQVALAKVTHESLLRLRQALFGKLLSGRLALFQEQSASSLANTVVYEVQSGALLLVGALLTLARDSLTLLALLGYLLFLNWKLTLIVGCLFPAVALVMRGLSRRLYGLTRSSQQATDDLAYVVEENVLAHRDIRLQGAQADQARRFSQLGERLRRLSIKSTSAASAMTPLTQLLTAVALAAVISIALVQGDNGAQAASVGSFVAFVTAMLMLVAPIKHLSELSGPITRGMAAIERGLDLLDRVPEEMGGTHRCARAEGFIRFDRVTVRYSDEVRPALHEISLDIAAGETVALVGGSGAGKTTLVNLLPRFVEARSGRVCLDDHPLADWHLDDLRAQLAYVSQHVVLLSGSVADNVALGQPCDRERVLRCLEAANLQQFVAELPQGMDTPVGHNAMQLSGGQRQRLAIARALYKDAPVLILDEATSALDSDSERAVQEALERLMRGRTTLVVAHRLSTVQHADRIVVLEEGQIVEIGDHASLLARPDGHYARLYRSGLREESAPSDMPVA